MPIRTELHTFDRLTLPMKFKQTLSSDRIPDS
jgi:hypothetical protein